MGCGEFDIDISALALDTGGSIYDPKRDAGVRTEWYMDENEVVEVAQLLRFDRLLPNPRDM